MVREEICKTGFTGVRVGLMAHGIGLPPIIHHASNALKNQIADKYCLEKKIICLAISEPNEGLDVSSITTKAVRDGADFIVNGEKTWISNGCRVDFYTTAVRTGGEGRGGCHFYSFQERPLA